jgi:hypothetical protein
MENKILIIITVVLFALCALLSTTITYNNTEKNLVVKSLNHQIDSLKKISNFQQVTSISENCNCKTVVGQIIVEAYMEGLWNANMVSFEFEKQLREQFVKDSTRISNTYSNAVCNGYKLSWY